MERRHLPRNLNWALQQLYPDGSLDLTAEGYQEAIVRLRKTDPNLARSVERHLADFLSERIFPRRKLGWIQTSQGVRARLALLAGNPHLKEDVGVIRSILGIPDDQVKPRDDDVLWKEVAHLVKEGSVKRVVGRVMASRWHIVHVGKARGEMVNYDEAGDGLSQAAFNTAIASAKVTFGGEGVPAWLQEPPSGSPPYDPTGAPLDWAVGRLLERHRLPQAADLPLTFYILTQDPDFLANIDLLSISSSDSYYRPYDTAAFGISVNGIDEFVTREDWLHVWQRYIEPVQRHQLEQRGQAPQGRRTADTDRLIQFLPLYAKMVAQNLNLRDLTANAAEDCSSEILDSEQETIRRAMKDLDELLRPRT